MSAAQNNPGGIPTVNVQEAAQRQNGETPALLIDVREMNEYLELRAESSTLIALSEFGTRFEELPKDQPLLMICRSGARSGRATAFLLQQGYTDVNNVEGGMLAWKQADLPTRAGELEPGEGGVQPS
jgi:rhodanese-related sulfurtransferase